MAEVSTILVRHLASENAATIAQRYALPATKPGEAAVGLAALLEDCASVTKRNVELHTGSKTVAVTVSDADSTAGDELLIGAIALTATAGAPGTDEYQIGTSDAATAISLAAAINAQANVKQIAVATAAGAVVTIAFGPGVLADIIAVTKNVTTPAALTIGAVTGTSARTVYALAEAAR